MLNTIKLYFNIMTTINEISENDDIEIYFKKILSKKIEHILQFIISIFKN